MPLSPDGTHYDLQGPADAPPVVLIHGLGLSKETTWAGVIPALASDFHVLSYDLPGHGRSQPGAEADLAALSGQLCDLLDHLGLGRAHIIGFSLGGMINRRFALDHPACVQSLAILNSPHRRPRALQDRVEAEARAASATGPSATIDAALARWFTEDFAARSPEIVDQVRRTVLAADPASYAALRLSLAAGVTELVATDPPLTCPTLVMTCAHDSGSTPEMSRAIGAEIHNAEIRIVPGLKHLGLLERPGEFLTPLLGFLDRHGPAGFRRNSV
jgi:pimeloyl-ACP methyl ester carboxylesterase